MGTLIAPTNPIFFEFERWEKLVIYLLEKHYPEKPGSGENLLENQPKTNPKQLFEFGKRIFNDAVNDE